MDQIEGTYGILETISGLRRRIMEKIALYKSHQSEISKIVPLIFKAIAELRGKNNALLGQSNAKDDEITQLQNEIKRLNESISKDTEGGKVLTNQIDELNFKLKELRKELENEQTKSVGNDGLMRQIEELEEEKMRLTNELAEKEESLNEKIRNLEEYLGKVVFAYEKIKSDLDDLDQNDPATAAVSQLHAILQELGGELGGEDRGELGREDSGELVGEDSGGLGGEESNPMFNHGEGNPENISKTNNVAVDKLIAEIEAKRGLSEDGLLESKLSNNQKLGFINRLCGIAGIIVMGNELKLNGEIINSKDVFNLNIPENVKNAVNGLGLPEAIKDLLKIDETDFHRTPIDELKYIIIIGEPLPPRKTGGGTRKKRKGHKNKKNANKLTHKHKRSKTRRKSRGGKAKSVRSKGRKSRRVR